MYLNLNSGLNFELNSGNLLELANVIESPDLDTLKDYYSNLLIKQYYDKPNAKKTIESIVSAMFPVNEATGNLLLNDVRDCYNLDTAIGVQLDVIGNLVGIDRFYKGLDLSAYTFFAFPSWNDVPVTTQTGFSLFDDYNTKVGRTLSYNDLTSPTNKLNDSDFRTLIKFKIFLNNSDFSEKSLSDKLFELFGSDFIYQSDSNMNIFYFISSKYNGLLQALKDKNLIPRQTGCKLLYFITYNKYAFFSLPSWDDTTSIWHGGFSSYADYDTINGNTLNYGNLT